MEIEMFNISSETKDEAIDKMREILGKYGVTDDELYEAFDEAVKVVAKSFGM